MRKSALLKKIKLLEEEVNSLKSKEKEILENAKKEQILIQKLKDNWTNKNCVFSQYIDDTFTYWNIDFERFDREFIQKPHNIFSFYFILDEEGIPVCKRLKFGFIEEPKELDHYIGAFKKLKEKNKEK